MGQGLGQYDAVIVGAGFGGIGTAIQLNKLGYDNLLIVEREADLGGTWHVNRYPGLACDIPSTTYSYWFEPNPNWSRFYAKGPEIKQYAEHVADKYDVRRYMRFGTSVEGARWDPEAKHWSISLSGDETVTAKFLIAATGVLSQPTKPDIPGLSEFEGRILYTTNWDEEYNPDGERVAVIGTGATAVQLLPELAKSAADLTVFQRTPIHVVPKVDFAIPPRLRRLYNRVPALQRGVRYLTDATYELTFVLGVLRFDRFAFLSRSSGRLADLLRYLQIRDDKELRRKLTPSYDVGCKRPTFSNSYYRMFTKRNVHLEAGGIDRIEADGIVANDGTKTQIDTLVLATGFDLWNANFPAIEVIGRDGYNLGKWWRDNNFKAYQGLSIPGFPNFLNLASPYAVSLNFFDMMEYQMRHMDRLFGEVRRRRSETFEVTEEATDQFCDRLSSLQGNTVFQRGNCDGARSYYFNADGNTFLRATATATTVGEQTKFPLSDYAFD